MLLAFDDELCTDHLAAVLLRAALLLLPICSVLPGNIKSLPLSCCTEVEQAHADAAVQFQASRISEQA